MCGVSSQPRRIQAGALLKSTLSSSQHTFISRCWFLQVILKEWMRGNRCWVSLACRTVSHCPDSKGLGKLIEKTRLSHGMPSRIGEDA